MTESVEEITAELDELESRLTPANKAQVQKYIYNSNEDMTAIFVLRAMGADGQPFSNAFYLHELEELEEFRKKGQEFVNVPRTKDLRKEREEAYDTDLQPHLNATRLHCRYLQLLAKKTGYNLSLGTCIEYDPISSTQDKKRLLEKDPNLKEIPEESQQALEFFGNLVKGEKHIFDSPISFGTFDRYRSGFKTQSVGA